MSSILYIVKQEQFGGGAESSLRGLDANRLNLLSANLARSTQSAGFLFLTTAFRELKPAFDLFLF